MRIEMAVIASEKLISAIARQGYRHVPTS